MRHFLKNFLGGVLVLALSGCGAADRVEAVRIGHFPNITHAQAIVGHATGAFEKEFGSHPTIEWKIFNAGPSAIEAIFAGQLDIAYLGPSPAINGYVKSGGDALRVIAGVSQGGAALVVRADAGIEEISDFHNKKIASPQLGNTQDVSLRLWLSKNDLKLTEVGGDVQVLPLSNADQLTLFLKKEIDAAWTVEPWVSILVNKGGGRIYLEESSLWPEGKYQTALVVVRRQFLEKHPALVKKFLKVHRQLTRWIQENPSDAKKTLKEEIEKETGKEFPTAILEEAYSRIHFSDEVAKGSVIEQGLGAHQLGYLKEEPDLEGMFDPAFLETAGEK